MLLEVAYNLLLSDLLRASETSLCWHEVARDDDLWSFLSSRDFSQLPGPQPGSGKATYIEHASNCYSTVRSSSSEYQLLKYFCIGDSHVGTTSFLLRMADKYTDDTRTLIRDELHFQMKSVRCRQSTVKLQMWDRPRPSYRRRTITSAYYRGANAVLIMYDVSDRKSFNNCRSWIRQARQNGSEHCVVSLVGCKSDLPDDQREVRLEEANALAREAEAEAPEPRGPSRWATMAKR